MKKKKKLVRQKKNPQKLVKRNVFKKKLVNFEKKIVVNKKLVDKINSSINPKEEEKITRNWFKKNWLRHINVDKSKSFW